MTKEKAVPSPEEFRETILDHYRKEGRSFAWRDTTDPYNILVSEVMLQQTQTERVRDKYAQFIATLPDFESLAKAPLQQVLSLWQGLGYNRRGIALKKCAEIIISERNGKFPDTCEELIKLPGIGKATASSILAFAFNQPTVFIETNIRRVFIHFYFNDRKGVNDSEIMPLVEQTLWRENPREWYYALMDYGVMLKKRVVNPNRRSAHYAKQSKFVGSRRQVRGRIVRFLVESGKTSMLQLGRELGKTEEELEPFLAELEKEGFLTREKGDVSLCA